MNSPFLKVLIGIALAAFCLHGESRMGPASAQREARQETPGKFGNASSVQRRSTVSSRSFDQLKAATKRKKKRDSLRTADRPTLVAWLVTPKTCPPLQSVDIAGGSLLAAHVQLQV